MILNSVLRRYGEPRLEDLLLPYVLVTGLIGHGINTCKGNQRLLSFKAAHIADLSHELRAEGLPNTVTSP